MGDDSFNPRADQHRTHAVQRTIPRYSVLAVAELVETASTLCIVGEMREVSRKGCYINSTATLSVNTFLRIVISRDGQSFVTNGRIIYLHEQIGMGVLFVDSTEEQLEILDSWLAAAAEALAP